MEPSAPTDEPAAGRTALAAVGLWAGGMYVILGDWLPFEKTWARSLANGSCANARVPERLTLS